MTVQTKRRDRSRLIAGPGSDKAQPIAWPGEESFDDADVDDFEDDGTSDLPGTKPSQKRLTRRGESANKGQRKRVR